jgi:DNA gyrase/topoisomerase IV subunit A
MNKALEKLNLLGVLALAALCVVQWRVNREANTAVVRMEKAQQEQSAKIAEQEKEIAGNRADLESFRSQLIATKSSETELSRKVVEAERANRQLTVEVEGLKESLTNWVVAVRERDVQLQRAATEIKGVVEARDEAIEKYNALAKTHNQLVADVNRAATNAVAAAAK